MITRVEFAILLNSQSEQPKIFRYDCIDIFEAKRKDFFITCQQIHCYVIAIDVYSREIYMHINKNGRLTDSYDFPECYSNMRFVDLTDLSLEEKYQEMINESEKITQELYN